MACSRPAFTPSDTVNINCTDSSRDNYALLPYGVAPMAPSGPIEWSVKSVTSLLDLVAESCRKSYDPLTCIQGTPGFWVDLAQKFRSAGLRSMVDTGYDRINNCFSTTGAVYTIPPIDPNSIKDFDPATYPWGQFFDLTYYFRTAPVNVHPSPSPATTWGVYQIYEYPNDNCAEDTLSECRYVAMPMGQASTLGTSCHTYSSGEYPWTKDARALSFKINSTIATDLTEDDAKNTAKSSGKNCGYYVYELVYAANCGGNPVCDCKFVVLNEDKSQKCTTPEDTVPTDCYGAQKVKYVKKAGPFYHQVEADNKKAELEAKCLGSSSSEVYWYVYRRNHYTDMDCTGDPDDTICDFIVSNDPYLDTTGCYNGISYTNVGNEYGYLTEAEANDVKSQKESECQNSSSSSVILPWHVYKKEVYGDNDTCSGDPEDDCLFIVTTENYPVDECTLDENIKFVKYYNHGDFATEQEAQDRASILRIMCRQDSSSSSSSSSTGVKYYVWINSEDAPGRCPGEKIKERYVWYIRISTTIYPWVVTGCYDWPVSEDEYQHSWVDYAGAYNTCSGACAAAQILYDDYTYEHTYVDDQGKTVSTTIHPEYLEDICGCNDSSTT